MGFNITPEVIFPNNTAYFGSTNPNEPTHFTKIMLVLSAILVMSFCGISCYGVATFYSKFIQYCMEQVSYEGIGYENIEMPDVSHTVAGRRDSSSSDETGDLKTQEVKVQVHAEGGEYFENTNAKLNDAGEIINEDHVIRIAVNRSDGSSQVDNEVSDKYVTRIEVPGPEEATRIQNLNSTRTRMFDDDINAIEEAPLPLLEKPSIEVSSDVTTVERNPSFLSRVFGFLFRSENRLTSSNKSS